MIKAIAFDLDDTLLDTTNLLLEAASRRACEAMISAGLSCKLEECLNWRAELAPQMSHKEVFHEIARRRPSGDTGTIGALGVQTFYESPIPETLPLQEGALEVLEALKGRYELFMVTSGAPPTQWEKIRATGLEKRFRRIFVVDKMRNQQKTEAFREILEEGPFLPEELLSVGNRLAEEIRLAKRLGALTCHFDYGEHRGEKKIVPEDEPDFTVESWAEFLKTCRL